MNNVQQSLDLLTPVFHATDTALSEWSGESNLQFPALMETLALKLNWSEEDIRQSDPLVRFYVRNHPEWHVTRGAKGGIQRRAAKDAKDAIKAAQKLAKDQVQAILDSKLASV